MEEVFNLKIIKKGNKYEFQIDENINSTRDISKTLAFLKEIETTLEMEYFEKIVINEVENDEYIRTIKEELKDKR